LADPVWLCREAPGEVKASVPRPLQSSSARHSRRESPTFDFCHTGANCHHRQFRGLFGILLRRSAGAVFNVGGDGEALAKDILDQVDVLSKFTHVTKELLATPELETGSHITSTLQLLLMLFDTIDASKLHASDRLEMIVSDHLSDVFRSDFFDDLDILSTHTRPQYADDVSVSIDDIDTETVSFSGSGSVRCELQHGSDGDCRRDDGVEWSDSFPFEFTGSASTRDLSDIEIDKQQMRIDTSKYYEDLEPQPE